MESLFQTDTVNEWGETESRGGLFARVVNAYFNPGTGKAIDNGALEQEVLRLNESQPDSVSPPDTAKTISYTDADGEQHSNQRLTEKEYNTLATVQGQTAKTILESIIETDSYKALSDKQKATVFDYVYDYAREKGRTEAIEGYDGLDGWMEGIEGEEAKTILDKAMTAGFTNAFSALSDSWNDGAGGEEAVGSLDEAYRVYDGLAEEEKKTFREEAEGRLGYFLEAKEAGVSTQTFTELYKSFYDIDKKDLTDNQKAQEWAHTLAKAQDGGTITGAQKDTLKDSMVYYTQVPGQTEKFDQMTEVGISADDADIIIHLLDGVVGTGAVDETGKAYVRNIDKWEVIAESGLDNRDIDTAMKAYMPDYDPTDKTPDKTELKYDAIRDMGISPAGYAYTYRIYADTSGSGKKNRVIQQYVEQFGCSREVAEEIYDIYAGVPWKK